MQVTTARVFYARWLENEISTITHWRVDKSRDKAKIVKAVIHVMSGMEAESYGVMQLTLNITAVILSHRVFFFANSKPFIRNTTI